MSLASLSQKDIATRGRPWGLKPDQRGTGTQPAARVSQVPSYGFVFVPVTSARVGAVYLREVEEDGASQQGVAWDWVGRGDGLLATVPLPGPRPCTGLVSKACVSGTRNPSRGKVSSLEPSLWGNCDCVVAGVQPLPSRPWHAGDARQLGGDALHDAGHTLGLGVSSSLSLTWG